jgi:protein-tyrosine phosphatase
LHTWFEPASASGHGRATSARRARARPRPGRLARGASIRNNRRVPVPSALRSVLFAPYRAVFYPFLVLRRARAALQPEAGGAWRTWITPRLLLGGFLAPGDVPALVRERIGAVVNVSHELIEPRRTIQSAGLAYHHVPCWDGRAPEIEDAARGVAFIAAQVAEGRKVYIHCASGAGRSVTVALCYLAAHEGAEVDETLAAMTRARPRVGLSRTQRAFVDDYLAHHRAARPA